MSKIIPCGKCKGTGRFKYKNGMIGVCYGCNGFGKIKRIEHKNFTITIINCEGERIHWIGQNAKNEKEAIKKARKIVERGCYKENVNTIQAINSGISYTYKKLS